MPGPSFPCQISSTQRQALNEALDREREQRGLRSDVQLAVSLDISPTLLSSWRNGWVSKLDQVLINLLAPTPISEPVLVEV